MGAGVNRVATVAMVSVVLLGTCALGYGVTRLASEPGERPVSHATPPRADAASSRTTPPRTATLASNRSGREPVGPEQVRVRQVSAPLPAVRPRAIPQPGPRILGPGDDGAEVRDLQSRLRQIAWYFGDVTDDYGTSTTVCGQGLPGEAPDRASPGTSTSAR